MEKSWQGDPFGDHLGLKIVSMAGGKAELSLLIEHHHLNAVRIVHGGVVYSLMDHAMGAALMSHLREGQICATLEIKINYLNATRRGSLTAKAKVIDKKRHIAVLQGEIRNGATLVAQAIGTFYIFLHGAEKIKALI